MFIQRVDYQPFGSTEPLSNRKRVLCLWNLYDYGYKEDEAEHVSYLLTKNFNSFYTHYYTSINIINRLDIDEYFIHENPEYLDMGYTDGFVMKYFIVTKFLFDDLMFGMKLENKLINNSIWNHHVLLNELFDIFFSQCSNWDDFFSLPRDFLGEFFVWRIQHNFGNVMFITPYIDKNKDEGFLTGFKWCKKICDKLNSQYDYYPYDINNVVIKRKRIR